MYNGSEPSDTITVRGHFERVRVRVGGNTLSILISFLSLRQADGDVYKQLADNITLCVLLV
jgi:hypothetical protein